MKHRKIRINYRQFCYVELFSEDEVFAKWDEDMFEEMRQLGELSEDETAMLKEYTFKFVPV